MRVPRRLPRLTIRDVEDLRRCADAMAAADATLRQSGWQAAAAVRGLCKTTYELLASLYNRAEPVYLELTGQSPDQEGNAAGSAAAEPPGDAGGRGPGQEGEEE